MVREACEGAKNREEYLIFTLSFAMLRPFLPSRTRPSLALAARDDARSIRDYNAWALARTFSDAPFSRPPRGIDWKAGAPQGMIDASSHRDSFLAPKLHP
jgi:hypothetical protein